MTTCLLPPLETAVPAETIASLMPPLSSRPSTSELESLVRRAQADDADAWEALYRHAHPMLLAYARRRLWDRAECEDAVSETFARAYRRIDYFEWRGGGFTAWLFGIMRNVVLEEQRRTRRVQPGAGGDEGRVEDGAADALLLDEEVTAVRAAFALLDPDDQEILELRVMGGLPSHEVATVVGRRPGAVRMAQMRAMARLRTALEEVSAGG